MPGGITQGPGEPASRPITCWTAAGGALSPLICANIVPGEMQTCRLMFLTVGLLRSGAATLARLFGLRIRELDRVEKRV